MPTSNPDEIYVEEFLKASKKFPKQSPERNAEHFDRATRSAAFGILAGLANYLAVPSLTGLDRSGSQDEISALLTAAAGVFIGSLQARRLCEKESENRADVPNTVKAGGAGLLGGAGLGIGAAALPAMAAFPPLATILVPGLVIGGIAAGITHAYNRRKTKYCPHCDAKGECPQRICRHCKKLFRASKEGFDCSKNPVLSWYIVASYLQEGYDLDYLDSVALTKKHLSDWIVQGVKEDNIKVDCSRFSEWTQHNKAVIVNFKGEGTRNKSDDEIKKYLDLEGL